MVYLYVPNQVFNVYKYGTSPESTGSRHHSLRQCSITFIKDIIVVKGNTDKATKDSNDKGEFYF